ncbi:glycosyltransferase family 4 protein [bacterium]|nr:glycosyltransferase family 4 protein [bacterium]
MNLVVLDLYHRGHHRSYIEMLCRFWVESERTGTLTVLVNGSFVQAHPQFKSWIEANESRGLRLKTLPESCEIANSAGIRGLALADKAHEKALVEALLLSPDHILCMFLDHAQLAVRRLDRLLNGVSVSGILFRPTLHEPASSIKSRLTRFRKRFILKRAVQSRCFHSLFSLDPAAVDSVNSLTSRSVACWLPDGTDFEGADVAPAELRTELGIDAEKKVFLLFGALSAHKGVFVTLAALEHINPTEARHITLVLAGKIEPSERESIVDLVERAQQVCQVVHVDGFVTEARMTALFDMSDVVLAPYQYHVGSSGVLIRAAQAAKPVIGSDFGMVGRNIEQYQLGISVDSTSAQEIGKGIETTLESEWADSEGTQREFVEMNSSTRFAQCIFDRLG